MNPGTQDQLRSLPAVDRIIADPAVRAWLDAHPRALVVSAVQAAIEETRARILAGGAACDMAALRVRAAELLHASSTPSLRRVINATGVVLHTGLGRAPLSSDAVAAVTACAAGYCNLEYDLASGTRGRRVDHIAALLCELTGAEAATVVNNNAAATLIILNTLASGAEVVVSRGQLVEIGGSYRLPDVFAAAGAVLREVGTTNRTRLADYERAISDRTAALLRVHTSNFRVVGFTQDVDFADLVALARRHHLPVIDDLGSGALADLSALGLPREPQVRESVAAGADLVCFSGDKLLGGPQAGLILGRGDLVRRIEANPLMRTYRVDKLVLAALEATLRAYRDPQSAAHSLPALALLSTPVDVLDRRAHELARRLAERIPGESFRVVADQSVAGGGSLPDRELATRCVAWQPAHLTVDEALVRLRSADTPVIARANANRVLLDVRTILDLDISDLVESLHVAVTANTQP